MTHLITKTSHVTKCKNLNPIPQYLNITFCNKVVTIVSYHLSMAILSTCKNSSYGVRLVELVEQPLGTLKG